MFRFVIFVFLALHVTIGYGRQSDSLRLEAGLQLQSATKGFQPLWAKANRFGMVSDRQFDHISWVDVSNVLELSDLKFLSKEYSPLIFSYGATAFNAENYSRTVVQQAYVQLKHDKLLFRAGRHKDLWDDLDPQLSSGSLGTSGNALPIPKITFLLDDYVNIPFTNELFQFKGMIGHGWMGSNRFMSSFLHEKNLYGRINLGNWKLYGGIQHYTEWGGQRPSQGIYLDRSLKGFLDVLFVKEANDGSLPAEDEEKGVRPNRAGDQRGVLEFGANFENKRLWLQIYNQTPFESGTGVDIRNIDRLLGVHVKFKDEYDLLKDLVVEFVYTKQMEDYGKEQQSYYNNGPMKTGWEYENYVIGTPLFTNRWTASKYLPVIPYDWHNGSNLAGAGNNNIINNRVIGGNVASRWEFGNNWGAIGKLTSVVNYGARNYEQYYGNGKGVLQCYTRLEGFYQSGKVRYTLGISSDFGKLYNNFGGIFGLKYSIIDNM